MLVNHGCLSSEAPFIHSDAPEHPIQRELQHLRSFLSALCSQHFHRKPFSLLQTSTSPMDVSNNHKPALADPEDRRNSPPASTPAPDSRASARTETNGGATEAREERNRPSVLFRSARAEGDRKTPLLNSEVESIEPCHTSGPKSPSQIRLPTQLPAESSSCSRGAASPPSSISLPKVRNWKKYKFIVLNSSDGANDNSSPTPSHMATESTNRAVKPEGS